MNASQGSSTNKYGSVNKLAIRLALVLLFAACNAGVGLGQTKTRNCTCEFDTKDYEAYGTNGACGIFMYNKARTCEVSFAGAGANAKVLRDILGDAALTNQFNVAPKIFEQYLAYEREGKVPHLDANFIETSLVVLERAALFRDSSASKDLPLKDIDTMFVEFSKKYNKQIATTFESGVPFEVKLDEERIFSVGRGYVELNFSHLQQKVWTVRVVYFSEKPR
jgi:hypothetical protein